MNALFERAFRHLSPLLEASYPLSKATIEDAFVYNHANNVVGLGANLRVLNKSQAMPGAPALARVMLESAYNVAAAAADKAFVRDKIDYDASETEERMKKIAREFSVDMAPFLLDVQNFIMKHRDGSNHNRTRKLTTLAVAKLSRVPLANSYRTHYAYLSRHVHADWFGLMDQDGHASVELKYMAPAAFACGLTCAGLYDVFTSIRTPERTVEIAAILAELCTPVTIPERKLPL